MRKGKLTNSELNEFILGKLSIKNKEILLSSRLGEDCAVLQTDKIITITTDPITATVDDAGYQAVNVCVNDIVSSGAIPFAALVTLLLPPNTKNEQLIKIVNSLIKSTNELNIDIIGGHTEFTDAVNKPIISMTMLGKSDKFIKATSLKEGDSILVTDYIAKEGTGILISNNEKLKNVLSNSEYVEGMELGQSISVYKEGILLSKLDSINSMHDITEGGVLGSVSEIIEGANLGAIIFLKDIPIHKITKKICDILNINPYRLISSGSMLFTTHNPKYAIEAFKKNNMKATVIGKVTKSGVYTVDENGKMNEFTAERDEIFK